MAEVGISAQAKWRRGNQLAKVGSSALGEAAARPPARLPEQLDQRQSGELLGAREVAAMQERAGEVFSARRPAEESVSSVVSS